MVKSQKNKNTILLIVLVLLIGATFWAFQYNPYLQKSTTFNKNLFAVENAQTQLTALYMESAKVSNKLEKKGDKWTVNNRFKLDPSMQQVMMALMEKIEIQREITGDEAESIKQNVLDSGIQVQYYIEGTLRNEFIVGGSPEAIKSYFVQGDKVYSMQLPGYQSYVAGIFEVKENDWRDRTLFNGTWQDIVRLKIAQPDEDTISLNYEKGLLRWSHAEADSSKVMDYAEQFNYFYVDQYLTADNMVFDYKADFKLKSTVIIQALDATKNLELKFYQVPDFNAILVNFSEDEWGAIPIARAERFFVSNKQLKK